MKYVSMNNGFKIPFLGTGTNTFGKKNNDFMGEITYDTKELISAFPLAIASLIRPFTIGMKRSLERQLRNQVSTERNFSLPLKSLKMMSLVGPMILFVFMSMRR